MPSLRTPALLATALLLPSALPAQDAPLTTAERTRFAETSRHADVLAFVAELQRLSPRLRVETMAVTAEGRSLPLVIVGDPVPASPVDLRGDDRAVVYIQANIHGGEVEGKENILVRMHSKCLTGDVFGSQRCDCMSQVYPWDRGTN